MLLQKQSLFLLPRKIPSLKPLILLRRISRMFVPTAARILANVLLIAATRTRKKSVTKKERMNAVENARLMPEQQKLVRKPSTKPCTQIIVVMNVNAKLSAVQ